MITTVTGKNMVSIPIEISRKLGIKPGFRFEWQVANNEDEILVKILPTRGSMARRLLGAGRKFSPNRDAVAELIQERAQEV